MGSLILGRNFAFVWALISSLAYYPYIAAGFIVIGMFSHWMLIRAVYALTIGKIDE